MDVWAVVKLENEWPWEGLGLRLLRNGGLEIARIVSLEGRNPKRSWL
jgi:hypothetical protein